MTLFSPLQIVCFLVAVVLFHRSALFVHEISQWRAERFARFGSCGIYSAGFRS